MPSSPSFNFHASMPDTVCHQHATLESPYPVKRLAASCSCTILPRAEPAIGPLPGSGLANSPLSQAVGHLDAPRGGRGARARLGRV